MDHGASFTMSEQLTMRAMEARGVLVPVELSAGTLFGLGLKVSPTLNPNTKRLG